MVAVNEALLDTCGAQWYSVTARQLETNWQEQRFDVERDTARGLLRRGFGAGPVEVVKDPRLCITLPFWLELCAELDIGTSVCVMVRDPREVARSLQERDGFPRAYGLRLLAIYLSGAAAHAPDDAPVIDYRELLDDPVASLERVVGRLPIAIDSNAIAAVLDSDLKHQSESAGSAIPLVDAGGRLDLRGVKVALEDVATADTLLAEFAGVVAARGRELGRLGEAHSAALDTLRARDADLDRLAREHTEALETLVSRDAEIREFDRRLQEIGDMHSEALATIEERDRQIAELTERIDHIGRQHSEALATIEERDGQIGELTGRVDEIGALHSRALGVIAQRDTDLAEKQRVLEQQQQELEDLRGLRDQALQENAEKEAQLHRLFGIPVVGLLMRAMWNNAAR